MEQSFLQDVRDVIASIFIIFTSQCPYCGKWLFTKKGLDNCCKILKDKGLKEPPYPGYYDKKIYYNPRGLRNDSRIPPD